MNFDPVFALQSTAIVFAVMVWCIIGVILTLASLDKFELVGGITVFFIWTLITIFTISGFAHA